MKIAILSDTHDNIPNLEKFLSYLKKEGVKIIIHCGDICGIETIRKIEENSYGEIYFSFGNADLMKEDIKKERFENIKFFDDYGNIEINGLKIAFCHNPLLAEKIFQTRRYDFVFHGHTHKPSFNKGSGILANPGNLAGVIYKATFAILDAKTKNLSLKILEKI